jgi:lysosomal Pro-X carboxypeptidase
MATSFAFLWFSFFTLLSSTVSIAKITPGFPSSIIRPEKLSHTTKNQLYKQKYFTQILDHFNFNPQSYQTFQQRYLINDTFWGGAHKNAPIFVYMGNEGDVEWFTQNTGFMFETAPHFKALLIFIEVTLISTREYIYVIKSLKFSASNFHLC